MTNKLTLKDLCNNQLQKDETTLVDISDQIWELGSMEDIQSKVDHSSFYSFVMMNVIGIWKGDGWAGVLENIELLPYTVDALKEFKLLSMADHLAQLIDIFPFNPMNDDVLANLEDHINFLANPNFTVKDEMLLNLSNDARIKLSNQFHEVLVVLDDQAEALWAHDAPKFEGWGLVISYINEHMI